MAHEITNANGKWEFAYVGEAPWHGLGQALPGTATAEEILEAAGLQWTVRAEPLVLPDGSPVPGYVANVRTDTREVLGVVTAGYQKVQNGDALAFLDTVVEEGGAHYHTAGSIRRGRKVFASAKLPGSVVVTPADTCDQYLLLVNNHDGEGALHLRFTPIRVVCANTLAVALGGEAQYQVSIRHMGDLAQHLREARQTLGVGRRYFEIAGERFRALSAKQITAAMLNAFLEGVVPVPIIDAASPEGAIMARDRALQIHTQIRALFEDGLGTDLPGVRGTAWCAFNAVEEWIERVRPAKKDGTARAGYSEAVVFGIGQELRQKAWTTAQMLLVG